MADKAITSFSGAYDFLSNFYLAVVMYEGRRYSTLEHAFQAAKTTDNGERALIERAQTPGIAKRLGRRVRLREDWEEIKLSVMRELLRDKFSDQELKEALIATYPRRLIEGNTWGDRFWGAEGFGGHWHGENHLGHLLMELREELVANA